MPTFKGYEHSESNTGIREVWARELEKQLEKGLSYDEADLVATREFDRIMGNYKKLNKIAMESTEDYEELHG